MICAVQRKIRTTQDKNARKECGKKELNNAREECDEKTRFDRVVYFLSSLI